MLSFLLGLIPSLLTPVMNYLTARQNTQVQLYQARTGASKEVAVAAIQGMAAVETKWWSASVPMTLIGLTIASYVVKAIFWDVVVGAIFGCHGVTEPGTCGMFTTDALKGDLHWVFITVITGYFGATLVDKFMNAK